MPQFAGATSASLRGVNGSVALWWNATAVGAIGGWQAWEPEHTVSDRKVGWGNYFRAGNASWKFQQVDRYVNQRLVQLLRQVRGRRRRPFSLRTGVPLASRASSVCTGSSGRSAIPAW